MVLKDSSLLSVETFYTTFSQVFRVSNIKSRTNAGRALDQITLEFRYQDLHIRPLHELTWN
jgi:hypothetical protein